MTSKQLCNPPSASIENSAGNRFVETTLEVWLKADFKGAAVESFAELGREKAEIDQGYHEYCRRLNAGQAVDVDAFCAQYPNVKSSLGRLLVSHNQAERQAERAQNAKLFGWLQPGQVFMGFRLIKELGHGKFARVFLATEPALGNRLVAVKISKGDGGEAQTLGPIDHPNIMPVFSVKTHAGTGLTLVCMPFLGSATLNHFLGALRGGAGKAPQLGHRRSGSWPEMDTLRTPSYVDGIRTMAMQLADALAFIHDRHICHLDLKPSNVLVTPDGRPILLDFNLSCDAQTATTNVGGTVPYMSPEQLMALSHQQSPDGIPIDKRTDLFSLGVMLFELLTGRLPFGSQWLKLPLDKAVPRLLHRQKRGPKRLRRLNPEVDSNLARVVERCLSFDPANRPQSANEVAAALRRGYPRLLRAKRFLACHRRLLAVVACMALVLTGAAWSMQGSAADRQWRRGQTAYIHRDYATAIQYFNRVLEVEPNRVDVLKARASAKMKMGEKDPRHFKEALDDLLSADGLQPSGEISAAIAYCMLRDKNNAKLVRFHFTKALQREFATPKVLNNLAYLCLNEDKPDEAETNFDLALEADPRLGAALHNRAMLRIQQIRNIEQSERVAKRLGKKGEGPLAVQRCCDLVLKARADIQAAMKCSPESMELYRDAGRLWAITDAYDPGDLDQGLDYLQKALVMGYAPKFLDEGDLAPYRRPPFGKRFQALRELQVPSRPMPPTVCIVNPLSD